MERIEGGDKKKGRRLGGRKETWLKWKGLENGTVALRVGARSRCDSNLMVGRYSLAGTDGLEKSVMTSSWQHHPNLFLIYTLHIMHSYNMTRKNKRLKRTGTICGYSRRWRNENYVFPQSQKSSESDFELMIRNLRNDCIINYSP